MKNKEKHQTKEIIHRMMKDCSNFENFDFVSTKMKLHCFQKKKISIERTY